MKTWMFFILILLAVPTFAQYESDAEEGWNYDEIIRRYSQPQVREDSSSLDPLDSVKIHLGLGLSNAMYSIQHSNGDRTYAAQRGLQVSLGIDLFSDNWLAEGTFRNFGESKFENADIALKEFDLKLVHTDKFSPSWGYRLGGGLSARYMNVRYTKGGAKNSTEYQTPASVVGAGLFTQFTRSLTFGAESSIKNALIDDTPDKTAFDLTFRIDGHF